MMSEYELKRKVYHIATRHRHQFPRTDAVKSGKTECVCTECSRKLIITGNNGKFVLDGNAISTDCIPFRLVKSDRVPRKVRKR